LIILIFFSCKIDNVDYTYIIIIYSYFLVILQNHLMALFSTQSTISVLLLISIITTSDYLIFIAFKCLMIMILNYLMIITFDCLITIVVSNYHVSISFNCLMVILWMHYYQFFILYCF